MKKIKEIILNNKYLSWMLIFTNWIFQGIPLGSRIEKVYKISFTVFFGLIFFVMLYYIFNISTVGSLIFGFLIAHTINWFVNCNFCVIFTHRIKWFKIPTIRLFDQLYAIQERLDNKNWILYSTSSGGICRGTMDGNSDIDVSLVIKPGIKNILSAILFFVKEKKIADFNGVPLDIFISETPEESLKRSNKQENPVVLYDPYNTIDNYYKEKMTIREAQILNNAIA
ncbi:hypothetical protein UMM65_02440 [Aureibaculum sp. 2210JD6-5]|uniref:hypothetical protein n=1 Tax=Aureibaculum sp. 2210JD6-5 TaxID=3103957 RepID=UPI002AAD8355|nr:hypothetical protein [Aureibaculum sp. 2210JD6-5]MDY7394083.1 hypothetical protein [Aureibaculum sp. 2210JD6-5]